MVKSYILAGKGIGLKWFFLTVILVFGFSFFGMNYLVKQVFSTPEMVTFFQKFPNITIQDNKIVSPKDTYVRQTVPVLPFSAIILDTMDKQEVKLDFSEGIYLTPTTAYVKNGTDVAYMSYKDILKGRTVTITPDLVKTFVTQFLTFSVGGSLVLFLLSTYLSIGFFSYLLVWIFGRKFPFKTCLRAGVVVAPLVLLLVIGLLSFQVIVPISWIITGSIILVTYWLFVNYGWIKAVQGIDETLKEIELKSPAQNPEENFEVLEDVEVKEVPKEPVEEKTPPKKPNKVLPKKGSLNSKKSVEKSKKVPVKKTSKPQKKSS